MGIEYFLFAAFVFALGAALVWMILKGLKKGRAEEDTVWNKRERKLEGMYADIGDLFQALEAYVEESEERIARAAQKAETVLHEAGRQRGTPKKEERQAEAGQSAERGGLAAKAVELSRGGRSAQEIAEAFGVSQGEVNLMLRLGSQARPAQKH